MRRYLFNPPVNHHPDAGWSSPVARQAHNLKAAGSNPAPATNIKKARQMAGFFNVCLPGAYGLEPATGQACCQVLCGAHRAELSEQSER